MKRNCFLTILTLCLILACSCAPKEEQTKDEGSLVKSIVNSNEVISAIRAGLREYSSRITVSFFYGDSILDDLSALTDEWIEAALQETANPREGDYIRYQYGGYESVCRCEKRNGGYDYTVEIIPEYYIYLAWEQEVTERLAQVYRELALENCATDEERIRLIYDYVCALVSYDRVHQKNAHYHAKSTAYAALIRRSATCQGYCTLLYRMLRENGFNCRVVTGTGLDDSGELLHAWNIVELDGKWYNLDATWDAGGEERRWYLRGSEGFSNHITGATFASEAFERKYPIAAADYDYAAAKIYS